MENNPVKQRIIQLTSYWKDAVKAAPEARVFCWMGTASVEYKMIQAFVAYHVSDESDLDDIFFCFKHPFTNETAPGYGKQIIADMAQYINAWNHEPDLVWQTGYIEWQPQPVTITGANTDARYFIENLETLARQLQVKEGEELLVVALFPQAVESYPAWVEWLANVIQAGIPRTIAIMVYDGYQFNGLAPLAKQYPQLFKKLQPDMDMFGAMNQILENIKAGRNNETDKQAVNLQQLVLKLTEAIGQDNAQQVKLYATQAIGICRKHDWPQLEALVHFFVHTWHAHGNRLKKAVECIDAAISRGDEAVQRKIVDNDHIRYHYRIAKGNLFFMRKKFEEAAAEYKLCLGYERNGIDKQMLLSIYQVLGMSLRHSGQKKEAWQCFEEGWQLLDATDEPMVRESMPLRYYAKELLDAAPAHAAVAAYQQRFGELWGNNWQQQLKQDFQSLKITQPA